MCGWTAQSPALRAATSRSGDGDGRTTDLGPKDRHQRPRSNWAIRQMPQMPQMQAKDVGLDRPLATTPAARERMLDHRRAAPVRTH